MLLAVACGPQVRYAATHTPPGPMAPRAPEQVQVFNDGEPDRPFQQVGVLSARGGEPGAVIAAFQKRAGRLGCDAIVVSAPQAPPGGRGQPVTQAACVVWSGEEPVAKAPPPKEPEPEPVAAAPEPAQTEPPEKPDGALGFLFGESLEDAQKKCKDMKHRWRQVKGARYSCGATPRPNAEQPLVRLRFCEGRLCEVTVEADKSDVEWQNHFNQSRDALVQKYGEPKKATSEVPAECTPEAFNACVADARVKLVNEWWWSSGERVVQTLAPSENGKGAVHHLVHTKWPLDPPAAGEPAPTGEAAAPPEG